MLSPPGKEKNLSPPGQIPEDAPVFIFSIHDVVDLRYISKIYSIKLQSYKRLENLSLCPIKDY